MRAYHRFIERFAQTRIGGWMFVHVFNRIDRLLMGATKARFNTGVGTGFRGNGVLLICTGARSGEERRIPLLSTPVGDDIVLVASKAGSPANPAWYHNLKRYPACTVFRDGEAIPCVAREAAGAERDRFWALAVANYSGYEAYQKRTDRLIPVMVLSRRP
jgi:deazaflavin-dependent oxidoreductase (nitroreductase family)